MAICQHHFQTQEEVDTFFKKYDKNHDGVITKDELFEGPRNQPKGKANKVKVQKVPIRAMQKQGSGPNLSREQIKEIFREHDIDGDGFLDSGEVTRAFGFLGSIFPFYKARYGLAYADANEDGRIGEDELDKLVNYAQKLYQK